MKLLWIEPFVTRGFVVDRVDDVVEGGVSVTLVWVEVNTADGESVGVVCK